jgi:hypothetical protein
MSRCPLHGSPWDRALLIPWSLRCVEVSAGLHGELSVQDLKRKMTVPDKAEHPDFTMLSQTQSLAPHHLSIQKGLVLGRKQGPT